MSRTVYLPSIVADKVPFCNYRCVHLKFIIGKPDAKKKQNEKLYQYKKANLTLSYPSQVVYDLSDFFILYLNSCSLGRIKIFWQKCFQKCP